MVSLFTLTSASLRILLGQKRVIETNINARAQLASQTGVVVNVKMGNKNTSCLFMMLYIQSIGRGRRECLENESSEEVTLDDIELVRGKKKGDAGAMSMSLMPLVKLSFTSLIYPFYRFTLPAPSSRP